MGIESTVYDGVASPAGAVTKSDATNDPNGPFAALWVVTAGNISFQCSDGSSFGTTGAPLAVVAGLLPIRCVRVNNTGTTAVVIGLKAVP